jgi:hypothetical protein
MPSSLTEHLAPVASTSSSGLIDGLGRRWLAFDREEGAMLERLMVRPELAAFAPLLREAVDRLAALDDERIARSRTLVREANGSLVAVSEFVPGIRLAEVLETAEREGSAPGVDAAFGFLLETLPALCGLHAGAGLAHGTIAPSRIVVTPAGQVVLLDAIFGEALSRLRFSRRRLWTEFGLAVRPVSGPASLDARSDIAQVALAAVMLLLGRSLTLQDLAAGLSAVLAEVHDVAQIRGTGAFAARLGTLLERALPFFPAPPFASADDALIEIRDLASELGGLGPCRAALHEIIGRMAPESGTALDDASLEIASPFEASPDSDEDRWPAEDDLMAMVVAPEEEGDDPDDMELDLDAIVEDEPYCLDPIVLDPIVHDGDPLVVETHGSVGELHAVSTALVDVPQPVPPDRWAEASPERQERPEPEETAVPAEHLDEPDERGLAAHRDPDLATERPHPAPAEDVPPAEPEPAVPPAEPEPAVPPAEPEPVVPPAEPEPAVPPAEPEPAVPPAEPEPAVPPADPEPAVPPAEVVIATDHQPASEPPTRDLSGDVPAPLSPSPANTRASKRSRRVKKFRSPRARKDRLRSAQSDPAPPVPPAEPEAHRPQAGGWLVHPDRVPVFDPAPEKPAPSHVVPFPAPPAAVIPPVAPSMPAVLYPPVAPPPPVPTFPAIAPATPPPPVAHPASSGVLWPSAPLPAPPVVTPPSATTPTVRLKTPAVPRRQPRPSAADDIYSTPASPPVVEPPPAFPWRMAVAVVAVIVVAVIAGRAYIPASGSDQDDAAEAAARIAAAAEAAPPFVPPAAPTGRLEIETQPAGARVLLNGNPAGQTPLTLEAVPAGRHTVSLVTGSGSVRRTVRVEADRTARLDVPIFSGWVGIYAPITIEVSAGGRVIGTTDDSRIMLSPGRHELILTNRALGYRAVRTVEIEPGQVRTLTLDPRGKVNLNATPWAEVWIDGKKAGDTPLANVDLPLGTREIVFRHPQLGERSRTVIVKADMPAAVSVDMTATPR